MLTTAGGSLEKNPKSKPRLDAAFAKLARLAANAKVYPARIRFVMRDVLDLRSQHWVARREVFTVRGGQRCGARGAGRGESRDPGCWERCAAEGPTLQRIRCPHPTHRQAQAKKLEEIRSEAQAELGIVDVSIPGLDVLPAIPGLVAPKRPEEVELFPAFK